MYPNDWPKIRAVVLNRDNNTCQQCGGVDNLHVHHMIPRAFGGNDNPSNLITLCSGCHAAKHPYLQASLARRVIERWALRIAKWLDKNEEVLKTPKGLGVALRLFKLKHFRANQIDVVLAALSGKSVLLVSPTGSGKSLCFQLPAILKKKVSYVIVPLKALMSDQVSALQKKQIPATYVNTDISKEEKLKRYEMLRENAWKLFYCTPERFDKEKIRDHSEITSLIKAEPCYLVIDEAHCIDKWGNDFRPSYGKLKAVKEMLGNPPILAFTATASTKVQRRILKSMDINDAKVIVHDIDRPNISLLRIPLPKGTDNENIVGSDKVRVRHIVDILSLIPEGHVMIFVPTVKIGEKINSILLSEYGRDIPFYHSKLEKQKRDSLLNRFTENESPSLKHIICTNAFGMGLDVSDVRLTIHWQSPSSVEDYLQEFGRCGRDGKQALAVLFTHDDDTNLLEFMAKQNLDSKSNAISEEDKQQIYGMRLESIKDMLKMASQKKRCFRNLILQYFGESIEKPKKTIGLRIIDFFFTERVKKNKSNYCCDKCCRITHYNQSYLPSNYIKLIRKMFADFESAV